MVHIGENGGRAVLPVLRLIEHGVCAFLHLAVDFGAGHFVGIVADKLLCFLQFLIRGQRGVLGRKLYGGNFIRPDHLIHVFCLRNQAHSVIFGAHQFFGVGKRIFKRSKCLCALKILSEAFYGRFASAAVYFLKIAAHVFGAAGHRVQAHLFGQIGGAVLQISGSLLADNILIGCVLQYTELPVCPYGHENKQHADYNCSDHAPFADFADFHTFHLLSTPFFVLRTHRIIV